MLKRKIMTVLDNWKHSDNKDVLFIKGPKGIGKTTLIENFAKENYEHFIHLDFERSPIQRSIFFSGTDLKTLTKQMSLKLRSVKMVPHKTLIFFDEVHLCPKAREAAKNFIAENKYDCIMSSSFAGADIDKFDPTPLEHETVVEMHSLDFEEFLWANNVSEAAINDVKERFNDKRAIPTALHEQFLELFKEYMVVGGFPEVVTAFINNHNFKEVTRIQNKILRTYYLSVESHLKKPDRKKVRQSLESIPDQLSKENKKFQYGVVEDKGNARKFESSILWLHDADMINISFHLEALAMPFAANARYDIFKVYFKDVGLLSSQLGYEAQQDIIDGKFENNHYAILESTIADLLVKRGHRLFYFTKGTTLSMEFMLTIENTVVALSVNHADNTKAKALDSLFNNYRLPFGIELTVDNLTTTKKLHRYPLYCVMFL